MIDINLVRRKRTKKISTFKPPDLDGNQLAPDNLRRLFGELPAAQCVADFEALLPWNITRDK